MKTMYDAYYNIEFNSFVLISLDDDVPEQVLSKYAVKLYYNVF